jgi:predicted RecB family nuclease
MALNQHITAQDLYNYTKCLHKVYLDANGNPAEKGDVSLFAKLLWEMGLQTERNYLGRLSGDDQAVTDLSGLTPEAAWTQTVEAMRRGDGLMYQGCLIHGRYRGRPDLLIRRDDATSNWGGYYYEPIDIKAGRGWEEREGAKPVFKTHYAYQMMFYRDLLQANQGYAPSSLRIINVDQELEAFDPAEFEESYRAAKAAVERLVAGEERSEPVLGSHCALCEWFGRCRDWADAVEDPTKVFFIGRTKFDLKRLGVMTVGDLARIDVEKHLTPPFKVARMGRRSLERAKERARVVLRGEPEIRPGYQLPQAEREIYFDIEDDPTRGVTYLYGLLEVVGGGPPSFRYFLAERPDEEERAVREFWDYLAQQHHAVYYVYSHKERTTLRRLMEKYGLDEAVFERYRTAEYDLYQRLVVNHSDWPTFSYGIKQIAKQVGFAWRDPDPSGVNSIVWYNDFLADPSRREVMTRILHYNEDDCRAMVAVKRYFELRLTP